MIINGVTKDWMVVDTPNAFHVVPLNDLKEHNIQSIYCWCVPTFYFDRELDTKPQVSHQSADGREFIEIKAGQSDLLDSRM